MLGLVGGLPPLLNNGLGRLVRIETLRAVVATSSDSSSISPLVLDLPEDCGREGRDGFCGLEGLEGRPNPPGLLGRPDP